MSFDKDIVKDTLLQICEAMEQLIEWNKNISTPDDYATTPDGVKTLAATCMLIEAISEGIKKSRNAPTEHFSIICIPIFLGKRLWV